MYKKEWNMKDLVLVDYDGNKKVFNPSRVVRCVVDCGKLNIQFFLPEGDEPVVISRKCYTHLNKVLNEIESYGMNCPVQFVQ